MRLPAAIIALLLTPALWAHPLDDKADMVSELALVSDSDIELALEFRYKDVRASYAEFAAGLDRNQDGAITRDELRLRLLDISDQTLMAISVNVAGKPVALAADMARFEFRDLNNAGASVDAAGGMPVESSRIFYRFVYTGRAENTSGAHELEYLLSGPQTVVHTPAVQMLVLDARGTRRKLDDTRWDTHMGMPRARAVWQVGPIATTPIATAAVEPAPASAEPEGPRAVGEIPAWLTLIAGAGLTLAGAVLVARRALDASRKGRLTNALMLVFAGAAIVLGALMRLGIIGRL